MRRGCSWCLFRPLLAGIMATCLTAAPAMAHGELPTAITQARVQLADGMLGYTVEAGRVAIRDVATGKPVGFMFYISYSVRPRDGEERPVVFIWNGGPGAPASSLNFEGAGPKRIENNQMVDNADTWLTDGDLVFVDPVGTGFSRPANKEDLPAFSSVVGDVAAVTEFVRSWLIQHRAQSRPLVISGQSYGAGRAGSVAHALLERGFDVRGLALISNTSGLPSYEDEALISQAIHVADYAVAALYYRKLPPAYGTTPDEVRSRAEKWVHETYLPALRRIEQLSGADKKALANELARRIGLPANEIDPDTVSLTQSQFLGSIAPSLPYYLDYRLLEPYTPPSLDVGIAHIRDDLGYNSDLPYLGVEPAEQGFAPTGQYPLPINTTWLHSTVHGASPEQIERAKQDFAKTGRIGMYRYGPALPGAAEAFRRNPQLRILVAHGAYDPLGGCSIDAEHARHLPPSYSGKITFRCYLSGHAIYRDAIPRARFAEDMRRLVRDAAAAPEHTPEESR